MLPLNAHFEGVLAVNLGNVVGELDGRTDLVGGQEIVAAEGRQTVDAEGRKTAVQVALGDILNVELCRNSIYAGVRSRTRGVKVIEPGMHLVDQRGRKCVGVDQCALLGKRGLIALLEGAAVRQATEDTRNELRIVLQAEPVENRIRGVEIDVQAGIKSVAMFVEFWRTFKITEERAGRVAGGKGVKIHQSDGVTVQTCRWELV